MPPLSSGLLSSMAAVAVLYFFCLDWLNVWLFARLMLR
jgi:hypothetical protein